MFTKLNEMRFIIFLFIELFLDDDEEFSKKSHNVIFLDFIGIDNSELKK